MQAFAVAAVLGAASLVGLRNAGLSTGSTTSLRNVSYDPTRELYAELNSRFASRFASETGVTVRINQSHGGSGRQARAILAGLDADVVTLALFSDTDKLRRSGLVADNWAERLPHHSLPYTSTIVFVVRRGNPMQIHEWSDLVAHDPAIIAANPETSGNGKLAFLAAWGSVIYAGGREEQARSFVADLYKRVARLPSGAREATIAFSHEGVGDVHLTWETEALLEVEETKGEVEIVYPRASIRAEPYVSWVDANVARHGTGKVAKAYLEYLFSDEAQELMAKYGYRPINVEILKRHGDRLPDIVVFPVTLLAKDWNDAEAKFFGEGGVFNAIHTDSAAR
jgi:sulfate transport system substrate-binding protein